MNIHNNFQPIYNYLDKIEQQMQISSLNSQTINHILKDLNEIQKQIPKNRFINNPISLKLRPKLDALISKLEIFKNTISQIEEIEIECKEAKKKYNNFKMNDLKNADTNNLHDSLVDQINTLANLIMNIEHFSEKTIKNLEGIQKAKIEERVKNIKSSFLAVSIGLKVIERQFETKLKEQVVAANSEFQPMISLDESLNVLYQNNRELGKKIEQSLMYHLSLAEDELGYTCVEPHAFTLEDYKRLEEYEQQLVAILEKEPQNKHFKCLLTFIQTSKKEILIAFEYRLKFLNMTKWVNLSNQNLTDLYKTFNTFSFSYSLIELDRTKLNTLKELSDLYWVFYSPLGLKISIADFKIMLPFFKDRLSQANQLEFHGLIDSSMVFIQDLEPDIETMMNVILVENYPKLGSDNLKELRQHRLDQLENLRRENRQHQSNPNITIIGGGPSGLIRGLTSHVLGANWQLVEKRRDQNEQWGEKGRKNYINVNSSIITASLMFFGVYDDLILRNRVEKNLELNTSKDEHLIQLQIGVLEESLHHSLKALQEKNGEGKFIKGEIKSIITGEILDIKNNKLTKTEVSIKKSEPASEKEPPFYSDIIIAADGANGTTAKLLGISREKLSTETVLFVATLENKTNKSIPNSPFSSQSNLTSQQVLFNGYTDKNAWVTMRLDDKSEEYIQMKKQEIQKIQDPILKEIEQKKFDRELHEFASSYFKTEGELNLVRPVSITITKAKTAVVRQGNTILLNTGDSYATPDPSSRSGVQLALISNITLAYMLNSYQRKVDMPTSQAGYDYFMDALYKDELVDKSFWGRKDYQKLNTESNIQLINQLQGGKISIETADKLKMLNEKMLQRALYTHEDIEFFYEFYNDFYEKFKNSSLEQIIKFILFIDKIKDSMNSKSFTDILFRDLTNKSQEATASENQATLDKTSKVFLSTI